MLRVSLTATSQPLHTDVGVIYSQFFNITQKHPEAWCALLYNTLISLSLNITVVPNWKMEKERDDAHQWHANIHLPQKKKKYFTDITSDKLSA